MQTEALAARIRLACTSDAAQLAALGMQVWLHTYATEGISPEIASYVLATFTQPQLSELLANPASSVIVAEHNACLIGYAVLNWNAVCPIASNANAELATLYIQEHFTGQRIGSALLAQAQSIARERAQQSIWLTVNANNHRAIAFYTKHHYINKGETYFRLGDTDHQNYVFVSP